MINKLKKTKRLVLLLLFLLTFIFSHGQDTLVKKRYLDSVKNQLAIYTVTSYRYLNMYDRSENDKRLLKEELNNSIQKYNHLGRVRHKENIGAGIGFLILMTTSFLMVIKLSK
jgi:hypothetical protein